jgi:hypothetical protein
MMEKDIAELTRVFSATTSLSRTTYRPQVQLDILQGLVQASGTARPSPELSTGLRHS